MTHDVVETPDVMIYAIRALEASAMRGMDALHVGAALAAGVDLFVTADIRQFHGAQALGLKATLLKDA